MTGNRVWLVTGDCGDYYCDGDHPVGIYSSEELAEEAATLAAQIKRRYEYSDGTHNEYKVYDGGVQVVEMTLDKMPEDIVDKIVKPAPRRIRSVNLSPDVL